MRFINVLLTYLLNYLLTESSGKVIYQGQLVKVNVREAKKHEILSRHPSVTDMVQSRCKCSDGKSISVTQVRV